jgi:hypothetical protein
MDARGWDLEIYGSGGWVFESPRARREGSATMGVRSLAPDAGHLPPSPFGADFGWSALTPIRPIGV